MYLLAASVESIGGVSFDYAGDLCELAVVELDEVISNSGKALVEAGTELGQQIVVATLLCVFNLHQVVFHASELLLVELSKEVCNFAKHVAFIILSAGLSKREFFGSILSKVGLDLANVFLFELGEELGDGSHVLILESINLGQEVLVIFSRLNLHEELLDMVDITISEGRKIASDFSKNVIVLRVLLTKSRTNLSHHH